MRNDIFVFIESNLVRKKITTTETHVLYFMKLSSVDGRREGPNKYSSSKKRKFYTIHQITNVAKNFSANKPHPRYPYILSGKRATNKLQY